MLSTVWTWVSLAIGSLALVVSFFAIQLALRQVRDERDFRGLMLFCQELDDNFAALSASHKRLRSRVGMRELRAKRNGEDNGDGITEHDRESPEEWKKKMRAKLHRGELKP